MIKQLLTISCIALATWGCKRDLSDMRIEEKINMQGIQAAAATEPVAITLKPIEDVFVRSGRYADNTYGSDTALIVKGSGGDYERFSYLRFVLPSGRKAAKATLRLYGGGTQDTSNIAVEVYAPSSRWQESTVTYNSRPKHSLTSLATQTISSRKKWYEWNLTNYVERQSDTIDFMIKNTAGQNRRMDFSSREGTKPPQLVLSYDNAVTEEPPKPAPIDTGEYDHIFTVWFENKSVNNVFNSSDAPYINSLKASGVSFSNFNAWGHPSQPNYIVVFSGSNQGVTNNDCQDGNFNTPNMYTSLKAAGKSFSWYSEGLPGIGSRVCSADGNLYRSKHNPTVAFSNVPGSANKPFDKVNWQDESNFAKLENCVMITPNMDDCMHDTNVKFGDTWLKNTLGKLIDWCRNPVNRSLFVIYFDEGTSTNNKIPVVMIGANTKPGYVVDSYLNHHAFTRMILSHFGGTVNIHPNVSNAGKIAGIWQ